MIHLKKQVKFSKNGNCLTISILNFIQKEMNIKNLLKLTEYVI